MLPAIAAAGETFVPLDMLRTTVSLLGATLGFRPSLDIDARRAARQRDARRARSVPTLLTALYRLRHGLEPIAPDPTLALRGELPLHDAGRGADRRSTPPRSRST